MDLTFISVLRLKYGDNVIKAFPTVLIISRSSYLPSNESCLRLRNYVMQSRNFKIYSGVGRFFTPAVVL